MKHAHMLAKRTFLSSLALAPFASCARPDGHKLTLAVGRLVRAALRFPPGHFLPAIQSPRGETIEDVLADLKNSGKWDALVYEEKREFTFVALVCCYLEGGEIVALLQMLGPDARRIATDFRLIDDSAVHAKWGWDHDTLSRFRNRLEFFGGHPNAQPH